MSFKKIKKQPAFSLSLCVMLPLCACSGDGADVNEPLSDPAQPAHSDTVLSDASDTERVEPATEYPSLALDISGSQYKNNGHHHSALPRRHRGDYLIRHQAIGEERTPQIDPFSRNYPTYASVDGVKCYPYFGWEEFMRLCKETEAEAVVYTAEK